MKKRVVYMCATDWNNRSFKAENAPEIFKTITDLKKKRPCGEYCGIIAVEMTFLREVQAPIEDTTDLSSLKEDLAHLLIPKKSKKRQ